MTSCEKDNTYSDKLTELYNGLADELNTDKHLLNRIKDTREINDIMEDPSVNYLQGRVIGFEVAVNALQAYIVTTKADNAGMLDPRVLLEANQHDNTEKYQQLNLDSFAEFDNG